LFVVFIPFSAPKYIFMFFGMGCVCAVYAVWRAVGWVGKRNTKMFSEYK
jgi:hypothetical protein